MSDTPPISGSPGVLPKAPKEGSATREKDKEKTVLWDIRPFYRIVVDDKAIAQGPQFILRQTIRFGEEKKWSITGSEEFNFFWFSRDLKTQDLPKDFLFPGMRSNLVSSMIATDITSGTQSTHNAFSSQNIFELFLLYRIFKPLDFGLRVGFLAYWTQIETTSTAVGGANPTQHVGNNGCIPGDIYCKNSPIPIPRSTPQNYGPITTSSSQWLLAPRGGPIMTLTLPNLDRLHLKLGCEYLVTGKGTQDYPFDHQIRGWIDFEVEIKKWFEIFVEVRGTAEWNQGNFRGRFDSSMGPRIKAWW